jgi:hypothetical protein
VQAFNIFILALSQPHLAKRGLQLKNHARFLCWFSRAKNIQADGTRNKIEIAGAQCGRGLP